jgi:hypothetical protein
LRLRTRMPVRTSDSFGVTGGTKEIPESTASELCADMGSSSFEKVLRRIKEK